jgi:Domain of unknown function (DUF4167)
MRQGQQNRRGRGRGRKPQNPLARNYESNGPDVKIRGTAAHIAEKYMSLARDALASGDMVGAESYLQHAEHYNRIIMAAQSQLGPHGSYQGDGPNGGGFRPRWNSETSDEDGDGGSDFDTTDGGGGADARDARGGGQDRERQGGGGQDRERHTGDREHHGGGGQERGGQQRGGGGREHGRHGGNGREGARDANGSDEAEPHQSDETTPDPVS